MTSRSTIGPGLKSAAWVQEFGGRAAATPADAARSQDIVFACVGNDDDLRSVTLDDSGAFAAMEAGSVFVDHTTASAMVARELHAKAQERGVAFIDAPVSGGEAGAVNGVLTVMCGGENEPYAKAEPVIAAFARACRLMGPSGSGQLTKMVNQICIAGLVQGLSEGVHFARQAGLDIEAVIGVISKGRRTVLADGEPLQDDGRRQVRLRLRRRLDAQGSWASSSTKLARTARSFPSRLLVDQFYAEVQAMGGKRWDTSSLLARLDR